MICRVSKPAKAWAIAWALMAGCFVREFWFATYWKSQADGCCTSQSHQQKQVLQRTSRFDLPNALFVACVRRSLLPLNGDSPHASFVQCFWIRVPLLQFSDLSSQGFPHIICVEEGIEGELARLPEVVRERRQARQGSIVNSDRMLQPRGTCSLYRLLLRASQATELNEIALEKPYRTDSNTR